jgi:hypothetical protein
MDYVVSLEPHPHGMLQVLGSWACLSEYVDPYTIADVMNPRDLVVRRRLTGDVIYRRGPFCGDDGRRYAAEAHELIGRLGFDQFLAVAGGVSDDHAV